MLWTLRSLTLVLVLSVLCGFVLPGGAGFVAAPSRTLLQRRRSVGSSLSSPSLSSSLCSSGKDAPVSSQLGSLSLVGAGPGDPDLLTMQALRLIREADLVVADRLLSAEILAVVECDLRVARKWPGCAEAAQTEIYQWVEEALCQGKKVVRLKIGDPYLLGRGGEELLYFRNQLGIEATVVPGISSAFCAPMAAGIPLTHRGVASQVVICTGYGREGEECILPSYSVDRTVVLLMAVGRIERIANTMITDGAYPLSTPVAIIERATTPQQRVLRACLENIGQVAREQGARAPATIVVGDVVHVLDSL